jgi:mRNA interferase MazF
MVTPSAGAVVIVRFPFSDLTSSKYRPAVVLAVIGDNEAILCQVTSNPYTDASAIPLPPAAFSSGNLKGTGYARPTKVFTAESSIITAVVGRLKAEPFGQVVGSLITTLSRALLA